MKKEYTTPIIEVVRIEAEDIIVCSPPETPDVPV